MGIITKKIGIRTAMAGASASADAAPKAAGSVDTFTTSQPPRLGYKYAVPKPTAGDLAAMRQLIEGGTEDAALPAAGDPVEIPRVPGFREELLPLMPDIVKDGAAWKSTIDNIEEHYVGRRRTLETLRLESLQVIATSTDVDEARRHQRTLHQIEDALRRLHAELLTVQGYRRNTLAKMA